MSQTHFTYLCVMFKHIFKFKFSICRALLYYLPLVSYAQPFQIFEVHLQLTVVVTGKEPISVHVNSSLVVVPVAFVILVFHWQLLYWVNESYRRVVNPPAVLELYRIHYRCCLPIIGSFFANWTDT